MTADPVELTLHILWDAFLGAGATLGFAVWFNVPRKALVWVVLVGTAGVLVRQLLMEAGMPIAFATFWAALGVGVFGLNRAKPFRFPRVIFTVTGIIPLIPGAPAYDSLVHLSRGDIDGGTAAVVKALLVMMAIAAGLATARALQFNRDYSVKSRRRALE
ncbi:MAG: threonine/serine exporter [Deltaproteobacteria bacterium]|nr:MAG: threonine/serine exporter [Deltaproteobacteria bacterium]